MQSFMEFLEERYHDFSSTQVNLSRELSRQIHLVSENIPDEDLAELGREARPHITVKYGLRTNDADDVLRALGPTPPIVVTIGKLSLFQLADADVLKLNVASSDLQIAHKRLSTLPNDTDYPDYTPHITIAYLKPGLGRKYTNNRQLNRLSGLSVVFKELEFCDQLGNRTHFPLA